MYAIVGYLLAVWSVPYMRWIELNCRRIYDVRTDSAHKQCNEQGRLHNRNVDQHGADATGPTHKQCENFSRRQSRWNMLRRKVCNNKWNELWPTHIRSKGQDQLNDVVRFRNTCVFKFVLDLLYVCLEYLHMMRNLPTQFINALATAQ